MSQHTPGPWEALPNLGKHGRIVARGHWIADSSDVDARLIAAAPEMLAILRDLVGCYQHLARVEENMEQARALLAKIEETP